MLVLLYQERIIYIHLITLFYWGLLSSYTFLNYILFQDKTKSPLSYLLSYLSLLNPLLILGSSKVDRDPFERCVIHYPGPESTLSSPSGGPVLHSSVSKSPNTFTGSTRTLRVGGIGSGSGPSVSMESLLHEPLLDVRAVIPLLSHLISLIYSTWRVR